jgi:hypothetical protein
LDVHWHGHDAEWKPHRVVSNVGGMLDYFNLEAAPSTMHQTSGGATARRRLQRQGKLVIVFTKLCKFVEKLSLALELSGNPLLIWQRSLDHYSNTNLQFGMAIGKSF